LDDYWDENDTSKGTYADNVNNIHVSPKDREKWESHVDDVNVGSMFISNPEEVQETQHHFARDEKKAWLEEIYARYKEIESVSDYITVESSGGIIDPKVARIGLKITDEMLN
jgi:hypothetical protein